MIGQRRESREAKVACITIGFVCLDYYRIPVLVIVDARDVAVLFVVSNRMIFQSDPDLCHRCTDEQSRAAMFQLAAWQAAPYLDSHEIS